MMFFELREEFPEIFRNGLMCNAELAADGIGDLCVRASLFQEFKHAGTDQVQPEHLSVADVEDDGSVPVVR